MIKKISTSSLVFAMAVMLFASMQVHAQAEILVNEHIEKALLDEDWQKVADLCGPSEKLTPKPVLRAIKGHACLALNQNNESLKLFLACANDNDQDKWRDWTTSFKNKHVDSAVACYLQGDAYARAKDWQRALESFNKAIELHKDEWFLALNARGVIHHALGNIDDARKDFLAATIRKPAFADAYASWGTLNIYQSSAKGVLKYFKKALEYCPDFDLAKNGVGCGLYGEKKLSAAAKEFKTVPENSPAAVLAKYNAGIVDLTEKGLINDNDKGSNVMVGRDKPDHRPRPVPPDRNPKPPRGPTPPKPGDPGPRPPFPPPKPPDWVSPGPPPLPDDVNPPVIPIPQRASSRPPTTNKDGGVTTEKLGEPRINKGNWLVVNWYGLGYPLE